MLAAAARTTSSTSLFSPPSTLCSTVASAEHAARSPDAKNTLRRAKQGEPIHNRAPLPLETLLQCVRTVRTRARDGSSAPPCRQTETELDCCWPLQA